MIIFLFHNLIKINSDTHQDLEIHTIEKSPKAKNSQEKYFTIPKNTRSSSNESKNIEEIKQGVRIFIGGIPNYVTENDIKNSFVKFGKILKCELIKNSKKCHKFSGIGFIVVENYDIAEKIISTRHFIGNNLINCKLALDKSELREKDE